MTKQKLTYIYEGETTGHWHTYSIVCTVAGPTKEDARAAAEDLSNRLNRQSLRDMLTEFHQAYGAPILDKPTVPPVERIKLRLKLIVEEFLELYEACGAMDSATREDMTVMNLEWIDRLNLGPCDLVGVADALADLEYVVSGSFLEFGMDEDAVLAEVHRSNMSKLGADGKPVLRADGKVAKGPNYTPPDIRGILVTQGLTE